MLMRKTWNWGTMTFLRPYIRRELPGWGKLYRAFVGDYMHNARWTGYTPRWVRGKLHGYEIPIDLESWSNRQAFFLGRYFDVGNQLILKALVAPGETIVDIGANEGMITLMAAKIVGPRGRVIAFEPNPGPRGIIEKGLARNGIDWVDVRPQGVSDTAGVLPLTVPAINSGEGSFGRPVYDAQDMEVVEAEVVVGDQALAGEMPRFIKIDVEGFELHVLKGLRATLERCKPIVTIEFVKRHLLNAGTTPEEVAAELERAGYRGWKISGSGRGASLRVTLLPPDLSGDLWDDFLFLHQDDPLLATVEERLARTGMD